MFVGREKHLALNVRKVEKSLTLYTPKNHYVVETTARFPDTHLLNITLSNPDLLSVVDWIDSVVDWMKSTE